MDMLSSSFVGKESALPQTTLSLPSQDMGDRYDYLTVPVAKNGLDAVIIAICVFRK